MWKNIVERGRPHDNMAPCALYAGYLRLPIHTHTSCVILIVFPLQQWLPECASMLRHTVMAYVVLLCEGACERLRMQGQIEQECFN